MEIVRLLLRQEGDRLLDINADGEMAFVLACKKNKSEVVKLLLKEEGYHMVDVFARDFFAFEYACKNY